MRFINLQSRPKYTIIVLSFIVFVYHSDLSASNGKEPERSDFHRAALSMRDEIFSNCVIKFDDRTTFKSNGIISSSDAGTRTFARHQFSIFAESLISNSADQNRPSATNNVQYTMDNGNRCIGIIYTQEKSAKILQHVFCLPDPRAYFTTVY